MPIYEYECADCHARCEVWLRSSTESAVCPKCGSSRLTRLLSTFSAQTSGEGACGSCELGGSCREFGPPRGCGHGGGCGCH